MEHLNFTTHWAVIAALACFVVAYSIAIAEERLQVRKSVPVLVAAIVIWILVGLATRYVSVASIVAAFSYSVLCVISGQPWAITAYTFVAAVFVLWRHRENVARLRAGTENRLNLPRARRSRTE